MLLVILDQNTGEHTTAIPLTSIERIIPAWFLKINNDIIPLKAGKIDEAEYEGKEKIYAIIIEFRSGTKHVIPCNSKASQTTMFTALTGGKTTLILPKKTQPKKKKENKNDEDIGVQTETTGDTLESGHEGSSGALSSPDACAGAIRELSDTDHHDDTDGDLKAREEAGRNPDSAIIPGE